MVGGETVKRLLGLLMVLSAPAHAALFVDGPATVAPGATFPVDIRLEPALVADIDDLLIQVGFDASVLTGQSAVAGPLLPATGNFLADAAGGMATHSFLSTLAALGPGVLVTWTFHVDPAALPGATTSIQANLRTFVIDNNLTAEMTSQALVITVVPEPSAAWLLLVGLVGLAALRARQRIAR